MIADTTDNCHKEYEQGFPLITSEEITLYLKAMKLGVEVFDEFPSDMQNVRHGVYINDPATINRSPYQLGVQYGANRYIAEDGMRIIQVTFQGDKLRDRVSRAIQDIVFNNVLLNGYHERDYTMGQVYLNRAEYRTYDFVFKRLEIQ